MLVVGACGDDATPRMPDGGSPDVGMACASDEECDDGLFCTGVERCEPESAEADARGCLIGSAPCLEGQRCDEASMGCNSTCGAGADADGDGFDSVACGGADCDDANPDRFPGNVEVCDPEDVDEDCDPTTFGTRDADGDGFVDAACCNVMGETRLCGDDCSDTRRDMRPGFAETCDFLDNDCDGETDEGVILDGFADADRDLHGDPDSPMRACAATPGFATVGDDCDDTRATVHAAQLELCDGIDNDCDEEVDESMSSVTWYVDRDGDGFGADGDETVLSCDPVEGFSVRSGDCDDADDERNAAADELCNAIDDDCDGVPDFEGTPGRGDLEDDDGDGYADMACGGDDCDDRRADVHPEAREICDGLDNDCDGSVDEDEAMAMWFLDLDRDGYGDESRPAIESCEPQPSRVTRGGDCDDTNGVVHPGVTDGCNDVDDDCNGAVDEDVARRAFYIDEDGDEWGAIGSSVVFACRDGVGRAERTGDCDDRRRDVAPDAPEICDLRDNDCDDEVDEGEPMVWFRDADGDGFGDPTMTMESCTMPSGFVATGGDCDDGDPEISGGLPEVCNGRDDDCDDVVDEDGAAICPVANGVGDCVAATCEIASCDGRWRDCDGAYVSGCEADLDRDPTNCGDCGASCGGGDTCGRVTAAMCDDAFIARLTSGDATTFLMGSTGGVLGWGNNTTSGVLGFGPGEQYIPTPRPLPGLWTDLALGGGRHGCGVRNDGRVWCWGVDSDGVLGRDDCRNGDGSPRFCPDSQGVPVPTLMDEATQVDVGGTHTCALRRDGRVWCWGAQDDGRLGDGIIDRLGWREVPREVRALSDVVEIEVGKNHTCARHRLGGGTAGFRVSCWGWNGYGQLGDGTITSNAFPQPVLGLPRDIVSFSEGYADTTCVVLGDGTARCWGSSGFGATATGDGGRQSQTPSPSPVTDASGGLATGIVAMCTGEFLSCALRTVGSEAGAYSVWCSGADDVGQLGDGDPGTSSPMARLQQVVDETGAAPLDDAIALSCGRRHACAGRLDGSVVCWGGDSENQIGEGTPRGAEFHTPVRILD